MLDKMFASSGTVTAKQDAHSGLVVGARLFGGRLHGCLAAALKTTPGS